MISYTFAEIVTIPNGKNADPQVLGEALDAARKDAGGRLRPGQVVEAAEPEDSPLHPHFEWNNERAGDAYRLDQARTLIRSIRVDDDDGVARPAFINIRDHGGRCYVALSDVLSSRSLQLEVRRAAAKDLRAYRLRYAELSELCRLLEPAEDQLAQEVGEEHASI